MKLVNSEIAYPRLTLNLVIRFIALQTNIILHLTKKAVPKDRFMPQIAAYFGLAWFFVIIPFPVAMPLGFFYLVSRFPLLYQQSNLILLLLNFALTLYYGNYMNNVMKIQV